MKILIENFLETLVMCHFKPTALIDRLTFVK
jgi:hypothetical protein